jgi:hypothetical protein
VVLASPVNQHAAIIGQVPGSKGREEGGRERWAFRLVIYDGTATAFFSPASMQGALETAQHFAEALSTAGVEWGLTCARAIEAARRPDPLSVEAVLAEHGGLGQQTG